MALNNIHRGVRRRPPRIVIYGAGGIGKSTFANSSPHPIFIPTEDGVDEIDCDSYPLCTSYGQVLRAMHEILKEDHDYQTVVIDSVDWMERLLWIALCEDHQCKSINDVAGGYGKGYTEAAEKIQQFLGYCNQLRTQRNMQIILVAHATTEKHNEPGQSSYDRWAPKLHERASQLICEWADCVLFARKAMVVEQEDQGFGKTRTVAKALGHGGGDRIICTEASPSCVAKNRYSLPPELPLDYGALLEHIRKSRPQSQPQIVDQPTPQPEISEEEREQIMDQEHESQEQETVNA